MPLFEPGKFMYLKSLKGLKGRIWEIKGLESIRGERHHPLMTYNFKDEGI